MKGVNKVGNILSTTMQESDLKRLFGYNRSVPCANTVALLEKIEQPWIIPLVATIEADTPALASRAAWIEALDGLLTQERAGSAAGDYLAERASREVFTAIVAEFALDGLTEAQNFFPRCRSTANPSADAGHACTDRRVRLRKYQSGTFAALPKPAR
jgi:hypothetical protein